MPGAGIRYAELLSSCVRMRGARRILGATSAAQSGNSAVDPDVQRLERELKEQLGARVEIKARSRGRGSLVIHYTSLDELDGILKHIIPS